MIFDKVTRMMNSLLYRKKINQSGRKPGIIILRRTGLHIPLQEVSCNVTSSIVTGSLPLLPNTLLRYEDYHRPGSLLDVFDAAKNSLQKPDYRNRATRLQSFGYWGGLVLPAELVADLVDAGFYLISQPDVVRCCSCSLVVRNWRRGDRAIDVHRRYNPNCEFVKSYCMQKISDAGNDDRRLYNDDDTASRDVVGVANQLDSERPAIKERIKKRVNNNTGLRIAPGSLRDLPQAYYTPASTSIHSQTVKDFDIWSSLDSPPPAEEISFNVRRPHEEIMKIGEDRAGLPIMCNICYKDNVNHVLLPCGDTMCAVCAMKIFRSGINCTICGQMVSTFYTIYM